MIRSIKLFLPIIIIVIFIVINVPETDIVKEDDIVVSEKKTTWEIQAIDTMKYSRDKAREYANKEDLEQFIDNQIRLIAGVGSTHVAISTPYDEEFWPFLRIWVESARKYNLGVWYRGNMAGWENWFDYSDISIEDHKKGIDRFIRENPDIFEDNDIFCSCIECENGGPGDPRRSGKVNEYREMIISEYAIAQNAFKDIGKNVRANYLSTNGGVADLIYDKKTTQAMDNLVVVDHYVFSPEQLAYDLNKLVKEKNAEIVVGEIGIPVPDVHGEMSEIEQAEWLDTALRLISKNEKIIAINYWTSFDGSTALWEEDGTPRKAVAVLEKYYKTEHILEEN